VDTKTEAKTAKRAVTKRKTTQKKTRTGAAGAKATKPSATAAKKTKKTVKRKKSGAAARAKKTVTAARPNNVAPEPIRAFAADASISTESDAIVIRFPSAAPTQAARPAGGSAQPRVETAPRAEVKPPAAEVRPPARSEPTHRPAMAPKLERTQAADAPPDRTPASQPRRDERSEPSRGSADGRRVPLETEDEPALSQSQKRRRRRKKRGTSGDERGAPVAPPREPPEVDEAEDAEQEDPSARAAELDAADEPTEPAKRRRGRRGRRGRGAKRDAEVEKDVANEPTSEEEEEEEEEEEAPRDSSPAQTPPARRAEMASQASEEPKGSQGGQASQPSRVPRAEQEPVSRSGRKEMIINVAPREECRIAILEEGKLEEIYLERSSSENHVGNIYKGVVTNVEPSIQAAFIDFGLGKNGFLHVSDLHPQHFPGGKDDSETIGKKMPRRARPPIQQCLRRGDKLLVQIIKEGIGTKGPTLTTYLSIPGRYMVMLPGMRRVGVSRKIEDDELRVKLREMMSQLELPDDIGFIARTAASERTRRELQADLKYLTRLWQAVTQRIEATKAPAELYRESDLVTRTIRDVYTSDVDRIIVDDEEVAERAREFLAVFSPRSRDTVVMYSEAEPIFHRYGIEDELERLHSRHVPLASGGSLVIDQTEALVAIDVNSGKFRTEGDAEMTAYKINIEAANEIARQLRLRDLGGVVVCDFIDMRMEKHKREVERVLNKNLKAHKERAKVLRMSQFGLIEITRQRQRASLTRNVYQDCQHCRGTGMLKTSESVTLDIMRAIQLAVTREHIKVIEVTVSPEVANQLLNRKRALLHEFETRNDRTIVVRPSATSALDQVTIQCYDPRGRIVSHVPGATA
jgi:ribonuclease E